MAHYGIDAHVKAKALAKRSRVLEAEIVRWIFEVIGEPVPPGSYEEVLKDGTALCKLINKVKPGAVAKINTGTSGYVLMENINNFIKAAEAYGVTHTNLFRTVDLFERKNIPEVTNGIIALGRLIADDANYKGPQLEKWVFSQNIAYDE